MSAPTWRSISHHLVKENLGGNRDNKGFIYVIRANNMSFWGRGFQSRLEFSSTEYAIYKSSLVLKDPYILVI